MNIHAAAGWALLMG